MDQQIANLVIQKELAQGIGLEIKEDGGFWLLKHYSDIDSKVVAYVLDQDLLTPIIWALINKGE